MQRDHAIRSTSQFWEVKHHLYEISALVSQASFHGKPVEACRNVGYFLRLIKKHILVGEIFYMGLSHLPLIFDFKNVGINCLAENGCPECASVSLPCTCMSSVSLNTKFTKEN